MPANLFSDLPSAQLAEQFQVLARHPGLIFERIVSHGQASPPDFWYDQPQGEWVVVLAGWARLRLENEADARLLQAGDWLDIAPHQRHRIDATAPDQDTIWLAIHYGSV